MTHPQNKPQPKDELTGLVSQSLLLMTDVLSARVSDALADRIPTFQNQFKNITYDLEIIKQRLGLRFGPS